MLFGIDIIITADGRHLIIDCNYFSSYTGMELPVLASKFDSMFEEVKPQLQRSGNGVYKWAVGLCVAAVIAGIMLKQKK
jgi:hypothetical protein